MRALHAPFACACLLAIAATTRAVPASAQSPPWAPTPNDAVDAAQPPADVEDEASAWTWFEPVPAMTPAAFDHAGDSALADLDGDGDLDLALVRGEDNFGRGAKRKQGPPVAAFLNDGKGAFSVTQLEPVTTELWLAQGFDWGDIDADGDADVVLWGGESNEQLRVYRNEGDGHLMPVALPVGDCHGACGCLRESGRVSLACGRAEGASIGIVEELNATPRLRAIELSWHGGVIFTPGHDAAWCDYDGDGDQDVAWAPWSMGGDSLRLFANDGLGTLTDVTSGRVSGERLEGGDCAWADLDADGWPDLVVANHGAPMLGQPEQVFRNMGDGNLVALDKPLGSALRNGQHTACAVADFDADGDEDLFFLAMVNSSSYVAENLGALQFRTHLFDAPAGFPEIQGDTVAVGDVNADGLPDIVTGWGGQWLLLGKRRGAVPAGVK